MENKIKKKNKIDKSLEWKWAKYFIRKYLLVEETIEDTLAIDGFFKTVDDIVKENALKKKEKEKEKTK